MTRYYDIDAANARLAELRPLLAALREARNEVAAGQRRLAELAAADDADAALVAREQEGLTVTVRQMEQAVRQIDTWGVTLRDIGTGLDRLSCPGQRASHLAVLEAGRGRHRPLARAERRHRRAQAAHRAGVGRTPLRSGARPGVQ